MKPAALALVVAGLVLPLPEHPPLAHTGGFGEPTCHQCHFDNPLNDPAGQLRLDGFPTHYVPGIRYVLTVSLVRPAMARGGFQLAIRHAESTKTGTQAGYLEPGDTRTMIKQNANGVWYAFQTREGTELVAPDSARWTIHWTAPPGGAVVVHAVGNAANDDASEFGDYIYTLHRAVARRPD